MFYVNLEYCNGRFFTERFYTKKHEWIVLNGKVGTVGISKYAQVS